MAVKPDKSAKPARTAKPGAALMAALAPTPPARSVPKEPMMGDEMPMDGMGTEPPEDFVDYAATAIPDLAADPVRMTAFQNAIEAIIRRGGRKGAPPRV